MSSFGLLASESRDLSHAEKEIAACKVEKTIISLSA